MVTVIAEAWNRISSKVKGPITIAVWTVHTRDVGVRDCNQEWEDCNLIRIKAASNVSGYKEGQAN